MSKLRLAAEQALEALEEYRDTQMIKAPRKAITALREALAKPCVNGCDTSNGRCVDCPDSVSEQAEQERKYGELAGTHNWTPPNYTDEQWQKLDQEYQDHVAEQEPVYISEHCFRNGCACHYSTEVDGVPVTVYAAPVRTKDLTDDEIDKLHSLDKFWDAHADDIFRYMDFARAVIAAYKEKNK